MSTRIVTLFGEEIVPEVPKPAAKPRSKKKGREDGEEGDAEDETDNDSVAGETEDTAMSEEATPDAGAMHDFAMVAAITADVPPVAMVDPTDDTTFAAIDNVVAPGDPYAYDDMVQEYASVAAMASVELLVTAPEAEEFIPVATDEDNTPVAADVVTAAEHPTDALAVDDTGITVHTNPRHSFVAVAQGHNPSHTGAPLVTTADRRSLLAGIRGGNGPKEEPLPEVVTEALVIEEINTDAPVPEMPEAEAVPTTAPKKATPRKRVLAEDNAQDGDTPNVIPADWKGDKNYYTIGEVATLFGVKTSHIRFWTNEFAIKVRTTRKGDRLYTPDQVRELRAIYHLVKERGFTLAGAKAKLKAPKSLEVTTVDLKTSLTALRNKLQILRDRL
jgi:DNA-binding transcriptional MerR regulator